jgi:hypothetical protein
MEYGILACARRNQPYASIGGELWFIIAGRQRHYLDFVADGNADQLIVTVNPSGSIRRKLKRDGP